LFLDPSRHECDWPGISCGNDETVGVVFLPTTNLTGTLPSELVYLYELQALSLGNNSLTGTLPKDLFQSLSSLVICDLSRNYFEGSILSSGSSGQINAAETYTNLPLQLLRLYDNVFTGSIPLFPQIKELWVESNFFTELSPDYATLGTLTTMVAFDNDFYGTLPFLWTSYQLEYLDLAWNQWNGSIPTSLWDLPLLTDLYLHDNDFVGPLLPLNSSGERLLGRALQHVWLESNQLTGEIPDTFGFGWSNLTSLLLYENLLTGSIDQAQCDEWLQLIRMETDCDLEAGGTVVCACCTTCHGKEEKNT
jgi:hypothetical protein